jgi:hypothetical protein
MGRLKSKFTHIVRSKIGPTRAPKCAEERIIWCLIKETVHGCLIVNDTRWCSVDEVGSCKILLIPKL